MIKTVKRTDDNEMDLSTGQIQYLTGVEGLAQRHKTRLQTFKGEWTFDESLGIAYIGPILGAKKVSVAAVKTIFINELLKVPGTKAITRMIVEDDPPSRHLTVTYAGVSEEDETFEEVVSI